MLQVDRVDMERRFATSDASREWPRWVRGAVKVVLALFVLGMALLGLAVGLLASAAHFNWQVSWLGTLVVASAIAGSVLCTAAAVLIWLVGVLARV